MPIGYIRVSTADGSQATDLQRDALVVAGVDPAQLYKDRASGKREARPGPLRLCARRIRWSCGNWIDSGVTFVI